MSFQITRFWVDEAGPHEEVATLVPHPAGAEIDVSRIEGKASGPIPPGPLRVVAIVSAAVDPGQLQPNLDAIYSLPLRPGARLVDQAEWERLCAEAEAGERQAEADVADQIAAMARKARADEIAAAVAAYMAEHGQEASG